MCGISYVLGVKNQEEKHEVEFKPKHAADKRYPENDGTGETF